MVYVVIFLTASLTLLQDIRCFPAKPSQSETPTLFVPAINYPALVHLHSSGYNSELLENAASFYNHDSSEYVDRLQKQILSQNGDKRLEAIFRSREAEKPRKPTDLRDEKLDQAANSILFQEEQMPEFHDLDRRYKRNLIGAGPVQPVLPPRQPYFREQHYVFPKEVRPTTWNALHQDELRISHRTKLGRVTERDGRKIRADTSNEQNGTQDIHKDFRDLSFYVPVSDPTDSSPYSSNRNSAEIEALLRTAFNANN